MKNQKITKESINTGIQIYFNRHKRIKGILEILIGLLIFSIMAIVIIATILYIVVYFS